MICPRQVAPSHPRGIQQAFSGDKWHPCLGPVEHRRLSRGTSVSPVLTQRKTAFSRDSQWPDSGQQRQVHDTLRKSRESCVSAQIWKPQYWGAVLHSRNFQDIRTVENKRSKDTHTTGSPNETALPHYPTVELKPLSRYVSLIQDAQPAVNFTGSIGTHKWRRITTQ